MIHIYKWTWKAFFSRDAERSEERRKARKGSEWRQGERVTKKRKVWKRKSWTRRARLTAPQPWTPGPAAPAPLALFVTIICNNANRPPRFPVSRNIFRAWPPTALPPTQSNPHFRCSQQANQLIYFSIKTDYLKSNLRFPLPRELTRISSRTNELAFLNPSGTEPALQNLRTNKIPLHFWTLLKNIFVEPSFQHRVVDGAKIPTLAKRWCIGVHLPLTYCPPTLRNCPINVPSLPYLVPYLIRPYQISYAKNHPQTSKCADKWPRAVSYNRAQQPSLCPAVSTIEPDFPWKTKGFRLFSFVVPYLITYFLLGITLLVAFPCKISKMVIE